jgi:hypothetical protein
VELDDEFHYRILIKNTTMDELEPSEFYLAQNYPDPFKEKTTIKYCLAYKTKVKLTVYNSEGEEIEKLVDEEKNPGTYEVEFSICPSGLPPERDGESGNLPAGRQSPEEGKYFYRLEAGDYSSEKKMEIIK